MKILNRIILTVGVVRAVACCTVTTPSSDLTLHCSTVLHHYHNIEKCNCLIAGKPRFPAPTVFYFTGQEEVRSKTRHQGSQSTGILDDFCAMFSPLELNDQRMKSQLIPFRRGAGRTTTHGIHSVAFKVFYAEKKLVYLLKNSQLQVHTYTRAHTPTSHTHFTLYRSHKHVHVFGLRLSPGG